MSAVTLSQANTIATAVLAAGRELGLKPLSVAVLDPGGHLIAFQRSDGASTLRPQIAIGKASAALGLGFSSRRIGELALERPQFMLSLGMIAAHGIVPAAGGVIIVDDHGETIGAVGVTGDSSDNDERCALAGIAAASLQPQS
jgi:uncharacterized protein GlcG (DUF336 family)